MGYSPDINEFKKMLAIVEDRSPPGARILDETQHTGIVPLRPVTPGAVTGSTAEVEIELPEALNPFSDEQIHEMVRAAEAKGVSPDQFFQIADELGQVGVEEVLGEEYFQEVLGTALAAYGAYKLGKAAVGAIRGRDHKHIQRKTKAVRAKADLVRAKGELHKAKKETGTDALSRLKGAAKVAGAAGKLAGKGAKALGKGAAAGAKAAGKGAVAGAKAAAKGAKKAGEGAAEAGKVARFKMSAMRDRMKARARRREDLKKAVANKKKPQTRPAKAGSSKNPIPLTKVKKLGPKIAAQRAQMKARAAARKDRLSTARRRLAPRSRVG